MSYENRHSLRDGNVVLYTRNGRPHISCTLQDRWCREGYIVKSTKRKSLAEAVSWAEEQYDDLRYKAKNGLEVRTHDFASLWSRWLSHHQHVLSVHRIRFIKGTAERYFVPYFGERSLEAIKDFVVEQYWTVAPYVLVVPRWGGKDWCCEQPRPQEIEQATQHASQCRKGAITEDARNGAVCIKADILVGASQWVHQPRASNPSGKAFEARRSLEETRLHA